VSTVSPPAAVAGTGARRALTRSLKALRAWPPLNIPATAICRRASALTGRQPTFLVRHLPRSGLVKAELPDGQTLQLWSRGDDNIASPVFWSGYSAIEPETSPLFYRLARTARTTLDIGAHVGFYALLAAYANPRGHVFAFEPLQAAYDRLVANAALNGVSNLSCLRTAAGSRDETLEFFHVDGVDDIPSSSSLSRHFMEAELPQYSVRSDAVQVVSIDRFVRDRGITGVDLVKIDTESTEDDVLAGMLETLRRDRPKVICEVLPRGPADALHAILEPLGYHYFLLRPEGPQRRPDLTPDDEWRNFLLVPEADLPFDGSG